MNYEDLYQLLQPQEKTLKDRISALQKTLRTITKETENGDLKSLEKDLNALSQTASQLVSDVQATTDTVSSFDSAVYFENGDFAGQMLEICTKENVNVRGEFPVYEMFPYRVKLDAENQDIYLDRKKIPCMRPASLVEIVKKGQDRLNKAAFNAQTFVNELAEAYDLALLKVRKQSGYDIYLTHLYKFMVPMSRCRRDYDQQSFAFDLARLYSSDIQETKNGRKFQFDPGRNQNKAIRILDKNGQEQFLSTICFYNSEDFGSDAEKR